MTISPRTSASHSWPPWLQRSAAYAVCGGAGAAGSGLMAAADLPPGVRGTAAGLAVAAAVLAGLALRRRDRMVIAEAREIAARVCAGEPQSAVPADSACRSHDLADTINAAARSMAAREARFALLARATGDAVWDWDLDTDVVVCTHGGASVLGADADAFVQPFSWWQERVHPDDRQVVEDSAAEIRAGRQDHWSSEYRFRHSDGAYRFMWDRGVVVDDAGGRPVRIVGCMSDISARTDAEERLRHVERRQSALITAVSSIIWRDELEAPVQPRNPAWEDYTGQTQDEEFGKGWLDAVHPDDREHMLSAWSGAMREGSVYHADIRLRRRDGVFRWMSARGAPVRDKTGRIVEYIGLYEDVEDYYAAQEDLRRMTHELGERVKEMGCLHAVATVCQKDDMPVAEILSGVASALPPALTRPDAAACIIEWELAEFRSPGDFELTAAIEQPLCVNGATAGRIRLGYAAGHADGVTVLPEEVRLLQTAAKLVAQTLARRRDRERIEQQSQELWRRQAMFEQTERLAKVGGWEFNVATKRFAWSEEVRRIVELGTREEGPAEDGSQAPSFLREPLENALRTGQPFDLELSWSLPDVTCKWLHTVGQIQEIDGAAVRVFGIIKDVTEENEARSRVWHMAHHDALTGLPNRRFFQETLEAALAADDTPKALLLIDLDHFKEVNDTMGHDVGDALLRAVSERLREAADAGATVARLGGDEFAVLAPAADLAGAESSSERMLAHLRRPVSLAGQMTCVGFSAGLALSPGHGRSAADILKNADIALYSGKARGRGAFVTYKPRMRDSMERRLAVCSDVRDGLQRREFLPYYQPKVSLKTGAVVGFEALLRWNHPGGMRGPASIMPAFEDHEIARAMCRHMLDAVVGDMAGWRRAGHAFGHVAVNTSAAEFSGFDLADQILGRLSQAGLPASVLSVEVTETVLLGRDGEVVGPTLRRLHEAGVEIALDDFGTGYASLTHLQQFPVDIIKIDQSFIRSIETDPGSQAIASAVLGLGRNLGMTVVAEGIETTAQAQLLAEWGCDQAQGYHFARPMPAQAVPGFLDSWSGASKDALQLAARSAA